MATYIVNIGKTTDYEHTVYTYTVEANAETEAQEKAQDLFTEEHPDFKGDVLDVTLQRGD